MKKILVVDDDSYIRLLLEQTLEDFEDEDVQLLFATDGVEGLEIIQTEKPDLVFLDLQMPRLDGFDVCNKVKRELKLKNIYIIILTAQGQEFDRKRGEEVGADRYMTKPFNPDEIVVTASKVLGIDM